MPYPEKRSAAAVLVPLVAVAFIFAAVSLIAAFLIGIGF